MTEPNESEYVIAERVYRSLNGLEKGKGPGVLYGNVDKLAEALAAYREELLGQPRITTRSSGDCYEQLEAALKHVAALQFGIAALVRKRDELIAENERWVGIIKRREAQLAAVVREAMGHGKGGE